MLAVIDSDPTAPSGFAAAPHGKLAASLAQNIAPYGNRAAAGDADSDAEAFEPIAYRGLNATSPHCAAQLALDCITWAVADGVLRRDRLDFARGVFACNEDFAAWIADLRARPAPIAWLKCKQAEALAHLLGEASGPELFTCGDLADRLEAKVLPVA